MIYIYGPHGSHLNYLTFLCHCLYKKVYIKIESDIYDGWQLSKNFKSIKFQTVYDSTQVPTLHDIVIGIDINDKLYWAYQLLTRAPLDNMGKSKQLTMDEFESDPLYYCLNSDHMAPMARGLKITSKIKDKDKRKSHLAEVLREYFVEGNDIGITKKLKPYCEHNLNVTDFFYDDILYRKLSEIFQGLFSKSIDRRLFEKLTSDFRTKILYTPTKIQNLNYAVNLALKSQ